MRKILSRQHDEGCNNNGGVFFGRLVTIMGNSFCYFWIIIAL